MPTPCWFSGPRIARFAKRTVRGANLTLLRTLKPPYKWVVAFRVIQQLGAGQATSTLSRDRRLFRELLLQFSYVLFVLLNGSFNTTLTPEIVWVIA
jgi:hypothetical protein